MRPLLALDLSLTSTGMAWRTADGTIDTRVIRTEPGDNPSGYRKRRDGEVVWVGCDVHRRRAIGLEVRVEFERQCPGRYANRSVVAEGLPTRNAHRIGALGRLHGVVADFLGFDPVYVDPATVKKHITGHGDASKREVRVEVHRRFPSIKWHTQVCTEDEIDALAVLAWAIDQEDNHA